MGLSGIKSPTRYGSNTAEMTNNDSSRNTKDVYLTSKGLLESKEELEYLKKTKRAQIAEKIHQAREYGDLAENSEYDTAMADQAMMESRIAQLESILKSAKVI